MKTYSISMISFNFDVIDEVDKIFAKHGIKFSYSKMFEKLNKQYGHDMKSFFEGYSTDTYIDWVDCKEWRKKYKVLGIEDNQSVIEIENGFVNRVFMPNKFEDSYDISFNDGVYISTIDELDKYLCEIEKILDAHLEFRTSNDTKGLFKELKDCDNDLENYKKDIETRKSKIEKSIELVLNAKKDFT